VTIAIDQAFTSAMLAGGLGIDIVHENGAYSTWGGAAYTSVAGVYTPQPQREFAEIRTFPAGRAAFSLKTSDEDVGLFQCILKYPADVGAITAKTKAEAVLALFPIGGTLTYSGQVVNIVSSNRDGGRTDGGFYQVVVRINYRAFVDR